jgi:Rrf2 family protein
MKISTKGRYAMRVMVDIAEHSHGDYVPLHDIARRQEISVKYLQAILPVLTRAGFLDGQRGKGGGYRLGVNPDQCTALEVLEVAEGSLAPVTCLEDAVNRCSRAAQCRTLPMWQAFYDKTRGFFGGVTIKDLMGGPTPGDDYVI